jgi:glucosylceramidase
MNLKLIVTTYKNGVKETYEENRDFYDDNVEMESVNIYPEMEYQTFEGFGGAITEASGYAFSKMSQSNKEDVLSAYFGKEGNSYNIVRTHIDSCDFSLGVYSALNDPEDTEFKTFTLERDEKYILPLLRAAQDTAGETLDVLLSPWSPPAFMKTNGQRIHGGKLKPEYRKFWAEYICEYIKQYRNKGFNVKRMTIQNEPNANQIWDSCLYNSQEEKEFLRDFLYPSLVKNNLKDVEVNIWDHNKERMFERACEIIDDETDKMVQGIAFHWYSGDHFEAIELVRQKFPDKKIIFTEGCVEYSRFGGASQLANAQMYARDIIGNINAGMNAFIDWNIILDEKGGPNHVNNYCDAPIMCDTVNDKVEKKLSYTYIGHFSKYIKPGAKRIAFSKYTNKLDVTAMKNLNSDIVSVILNKEDKDMSVAFRISGKAVKIIVPAESIITVIIK